jgi:hypothetical protein
MDPLHITPPFTYSYQCGSTLLVAYIPVYMYSITIQILLQGVKLLLMTFFYTNKNTFAKRFDTSLPWLGLLPSQVISSLMNNIMLLLSFGLCSPVLGCYILLSICVSSMTWQILIGRYLRDKMTSNQVLSEFDQLTCVRDTIELSNFKMLSEDSTLNILVLDEDASLKLETAELESDPKRPGVGQANQEIVPEHFVISARSAVNSVLICKWPILWTSCVFITLLCWEIVGDQVGWAGGWWILLFGALIMIGAWVCDRWLNSQA